MAKARVRQRESEEQADFDDSLPPEDDEPAEAPAPASPYDHLSREQLVALLGVHDELSALVARFQQELGEFTADARKRLAAVGARG